MKDQPQTPGAMVLAPVKLLETIEKSWRIPNGCPASVSEEVGEIIRNGLSELRAILAAPAEQSPAVGGEPITRWHPQKTPIGTVAKPHSEGDFVTLEDHCAHVAPLRAEIERMRALLGNSYSAGVALSKEIDQLNASTTELEAQIAKANNWQHLKPDMDPLKP